MFSIVLTISSSETPAVWKQDQYLHVWPLSCDQCLMYDHCHVTSAWCMTIVMWPMLDVWPLSCDQCLMYDHCHVTSAWCLTIVMWPMLDVWPLSCDISWCMTIVMWFSPAVAKGRWTTIWWPRTSGPGNWPLMERDTVRTFLLWLR